MTNTLTPEQIAQAESALNTIDIADDMCVFREEIETLRSLIHSLSSPPVSGEVVAWANPQEMRLWKTGKNRPVTLRQWQDSYCTGPLYASPLTNEPEGVTISRSDFEDIIGYMRPLVAKWRHHEAGKSLGELFDRLSASITGEKG